MEDYLKNNYEFLIHMNGYNLEGDFIKQKGSRRDYMIVNTEYAKELVQHCVFLLEELDKENFLVIRYKGTNCIEERYYGILFQAAKEKHGFSSTIFYGPDTASVITQVEENLAQVVRQKKTKEMVN